MSTTHQSLIGWIARVPARFGAYALQACASQGITGMSSKFLREAGVPPAVPGVPNQMSKLLVPEGRF
jgi:hypothetical protein